MADYAEHAALQGIGSKSCPKCEVRCEELSGDPRRMYKTRKYMLYRKHALRHWPAEVSGIAEYLQRLGVKIGNCNKHIPVGVSLNGERLIVVHIVIVDYLHSPVRGSLIVIRPEDTKSNR